MIKYPVMILYMFYVCVCVSVMFCTNVLMTVCTINLLQQDLFLLTIIILKALCNRRNGAKHIYIKLIFFF